MICPCCRVRAPAGLLMGSPYSRWPCRLLTSRSSDTPRPRVAELPCFVLLAVCGLPFSGTRAAIRATWSRAGPRARPSQCRWMLMSRMAAPHLIGPPEASICRQDIRRLRRLVVPSEAAVPASLSHSGSAIGLVVRIWLTVARGCTAPGRRSWAGYGSWSPGGPSDCIVHPRALVSIAKNAAQGEGKMSHPCFRRNASEQYGQSYAPPVPAIIEKRRSGGCVHGGATSRLGRGIGPP